MSKHYQEGDIVYIVSKPARGAPFVRVCRVYDQYSNGVCVDYLVPRERRLVDGIPIESYANDSHYGALRKLPKNWSWKTVLFETSIRPDDELDTFMETHYFNVPAHVQEACEKGFLVPANTIFDGIPESEVTASGFRVLLKANRDPKPKSACVNTSEVYDTYEGAKNALDDYNAKQKAISEMSDRDWSLLQIKKVVEPAMALDGFTQDDIQLVMNWFEGMSDIEDIEARRFNGQIQFKHWKKSRWNPLPSLEEISKWEP